MDGAFIVCIPMPGPVPTAGTQKPQEHQDACTCRSQANRKINGSQHLRLRAAGLQRGGLAAWGQGSTPPCAQDQKIRGWPVDVGGVCRGKSVTKARGGEKRLFGRKGDRSEAERAR